MITPAHGARIARILEFWFAGGETSGLAGRMAFWFTADEAVDNDIRARFAADVAQASAGEFAAWESFTDGRLALILLLDQFRRSLYRGTAAAFACDGRALALTLAGLEQRVDGELTAEQRICFLMPLQHAESAGAQEISVREFERLRVSANSVPRNVYETCAAFAREHRDIIARFGRFPHRNRALGRTNTPDEAAWLAAGGATFGQ